MASVTSVQQVVDATKAALAAQGTALVGKVKGVIAYSMGDDSFTVDLKNGSGAVHTGVCRSCKCSAASSSTTRRPFSVAGVEPKADLVITLNKDDFLSISNGKLNPQQVRRQGGWPASTHRTA